MKPSLAPFDEFKGSSSEACNSADLADTTVPGKHLTGSEIDRLVNHLIACKTGEEGRSIPDAELHNICEHVIPCRWCRSKLQALMIAADDNGPEDRTPDLLHMELDEIHISTPPQRDYEGLHGLRLIESLGEIEVAEEAFLCV